MNLMTEMTEHRKYLISGIENEHKRFEGLAKLLFAQPNKYAEAVDAMGMSEAMKAAAEALKRDEAVRLGGLGGSYE